MTSSASGASGASGSSGSSGDTPRPPPRALEKIGDNPFYVLGLRPTATRAEVEREGQKLLGMLELQIASVARYPTPLGSMPRTADKVRGAMAELRDPQRRLEHELWASLEATAKAKLHDEDEAQTVTKPSPRAEDAWETALADLGWRARG